MVRVRLMFLRVPEPDRPEWEPFLFLLLAINLFHVLFSLLFCTALFDLSFFGVPSFSILVFLFPTRGPAAERERSAAANASMEAGSHSRKLGKGKLNFCNNVRVCARCSVPQMLTLQISLGGSSKQRGHGGYATWMYPPA